jgi:hypothetical protein
MSELEEKLNKILSNPAEMEKIMNIARSLSGSIGSQPAAGDRGDTPASEASSSPSGSLDLNSLATILKDVDPRIFRLVTRLASEYASGSNDKAALLNAMKPYLKEDRRAKIDRAAEIAKLAKLAKVAFSEFAGGDKRV